MSFPLLTSVVVVPAAAAMCALAAPDSDQARRIARGATLATLALSLLVVALFDRSIVGPQLGEIGPSLPLLHARYRLGIDGLGVGMLPLTAALAFAVVVGGPHRKLDAAYLAAVLATESASIALYAAQDAALLLVCWLAALLPAYALMTRGEDTPLQTDSTRTYAVYLFGGSLPLLGVVGLLGWLGFRAGAAAPFDLADAAARGVPAALQRALLVMVALAVVVRMGIAPFHSWMPLLLERGPLGPGVLMTGAHAGLYLLSVLGIRLAPHASASAFPLLGPIALFSTLVGAVLALTQDNLRRAIGYLAVSQSGMMLVGLASLDARSVNGALLHVFASSAALSGLLLLTWSLEQRTGTADISRLGGVARAAPGLATLFLLFCLAAAGFPGTLGFASEDLLVEGVLGAHPGVAAGLLVATALNGVTLLRAFARALLGPASAVTTPARELLPRERHAAFALAAILFLGGVAPGPLVALRSGAVDILVGDAPAHGHP
jgi:NADH-quinone oxidoreductase subunit M